MPRSDYAPISRRIGGHQWRGLPDGHSRAAHVRRVSRRSRWTYRRRREARAARSTAIRRDAPFKGPSAPAFRASLASPASRASRLALEASRGLRVRWHAGCYQHPRHPRHRGHQGDSGCRGHTQDTRRSWPRASSFLAATIAATSMTCSVISATSVTTQRSKNCPALDEYLCWQCVVRTCNGREPEQPREAIWVGRRLGDRSRPSENHPPRPPHHTASSYRASGGNSWMLSCRAARLRAQEGGGVRGFLQRHRNATLDGCSRMRPTMRGALPSA